MGKKTGSWLLLFLLILSLFSAVTFSTPTSGIFLIQNPGDWEAAGFDPDGLPVYTPDSLTDFFMPIALKKDDIQNLKASDVDHTIKHADDNFNNRLRSISFEILESSTYYVVLYHMKVFASTDGFSIDFVPKIRGEELGQFAWWDSDWSKRKDIFIDKDQLKNTVANFPVFINISAAEMVGDVQNDLGDIVFVDTANTTKLDHEIEKYSIGATVEARIWVEVPKINGSDHTDNTHFNMYYNHSDVVDQANPTGVWDSNYLMVYHMNSSTTKTRGCYDSTSNAAHADFNDNLPTTATGIVGDGQRSDGSGDWITETNTVSATLLDGTWEIWYNTIEYNEDDVLIKFYKDTSNFIMLRLRQGIGPPEGHDYRGDFGGTSQWDDEYFSGISPFSWNNTMQHWADGDEMNLWLDGDLVDTDSSVNTISLVTGDWFICSDTPAPSNTFRGIIDEVRFSKTKRNNTWMEATYNSIINDSTFVTIGAERTWSETNPVTSVTVETQSKTYIAINWTQSINGNYSILERNIISSWGRGSGLLLYNGTDWSYNDTNCSEYSVFYYQIWAFNESTHDFSSVETGNNHTGPTYPTNVENAISGTTINITWTKGIRADNTVIYRKSGSYSTVIGDGTELFNGSDATGYDDASWNNNQHYTIYSYNTTVNIASSGVQIRWGALNITAKNASNNVSLTSFWVTVSNQSGSEVYDSASTGSYANIGINDLPTGDNVIIQVNATGYKDAIYYMDITPGNYYSLVAYLAPDIGTNQYVLRVIDEYNEPVEDVKVRVLRLIGGVYENVTITFTGANGYANVYLVPDVVYKVNLSKSGYIGKTENYIPDPDYYGIYYPKTFKIETESIIPISVSFGDICRLNGSWITSNNSLLVTFSDNYGQTDNIQFYIYENYGGTLVLNATESFTDESNISFYVEGLNTTLNTTRAHDIVIFHNHTTIGYTENFRITVAPLKADVLESDWIESIFDDAFGDFELGYVNFFGVWGPAMLILLAGCAIKQPGVGITGMSFWAALLNWKLETSLDANLYILFSLLVILGFIAIIIQNRRH